MAIPWTSQDDDDDDDDENDVDEFEKSLFGIMLVFGVYVVVKFFVVTATGIGLRVTIAVALGNDGRPNWSRMGQKISPSSGKHPFNVLGLVHTTPYSSFTCKQVGAEQTASGAV